MKATEFIRKNLDGTKGWTLGLIADMKDSPLTQPTPNGGNHVAWILSHLIHSESNLLDVFLLGKPNRFPELASCSMKSEPTTNADDYLPMDELMAKFEEIRSASIAHLDTLTDDDLDAKSHAPEEMGDMFGTAGGVFAAMCTHVAFHGGQVADCRRAAGRGPLMA